MRNKKLKQEMTERVRDQVFLNQLSQLVSDVAWGSYLAPLTKGGAKYPHLHEDLYNEIYDRDVAKLMDPKSKDSKRIKKIVKDIKTPSQHEAKKLTPLQTGIAVACVGLLANEAYKNVDPFRKAVDDARLRAGIVRDKTRAKINKTLFPGS